MEDILRSLVPLNKRQIERLWNDWHVWARDDQLEPSVTEGCPPWRTWLLVGGRGAGKTRAGSEWIRARVAASTRGPAGPLRIALVGETLLDVRSVMIEGVSGILAMQPEETRPLFEPSKKQLTWACGAVAQMFSAEDPDSLRGPQFHIAWCDEIAKWRYAERTWDMLQFGLRLGEQPQQLVTTTPRPIPLLRTLIEDSGTVVTRARTADNSANLAPSFLAEMERRYAGSVLGRQELLGELVSDPTGALWRQDWIDEARVQSPAPLERVVVAVDPPVTATARSDLCGIVAAGTGANGRYYVLADRSIQGQAPDVWAQRAIALYREIEADCLVAEVNQGGDMVAAVLHHMAPDVPVKQVRATRGKWLRAEPIAALYAQARVAHVGRLKELEAQMISYGSNDWPGNSSPDRLDALVWAITELTSSTSAARPNIRAL